MTQKPRKMSEDTLEALSSIISCPICHLPGVELEEVTLLRIEESEEGYRKIRHIRGKCWNCCENGRGEVKIDVYQRF